MNGMSMMKGTVDKAAENVCGKTEGHFTLWGNKLRLYGHNSFVRPCSVLKLLV